MEFYIGLVIIMKDKQTELTWMIRQSEKNQLKFEKNQFFKATGVVTRPLGL